MDFALSEIDTKPGAQSGTAVALLKLDGTPLTNAKQEPVTLTLLGADSDTYRRLSRELGRKRIVRMQKNRGGAATDEELDLQEKEDIQLLASATLAWSGILDSKKADIPFNRENAIDLYTKFPVAREQAERAIIDRTRFIQPSR